MPPVNRLLVILLDAVAIGVTATQTTLSISLPLLSKRFPFPQSSRKITSFGSLKTFLEVSTQTITALPSSTAAVRQSVAVRFLMGKV